VWSVVAVCVLVVMVVGLPTVAGYGMGARPLDRNGRLFSLRFLHIPKTGTSFIIVLRNYLTGE
jgi:hypothetical protein